MVIELSGVQFGLNPLLPPILCLPLSAPSLSLSAPLD